MKRISTLLIVGTILSAWVSALSAPALVVRMIDGTKHTFMLDENPIITMNRTMISIMSDNTKIELETDKVAKFTNEEVDFDSIESIASSNYYKGGTIFFESAERDFEMNIYTLTGVVIKSVRIAAGTSGSISLNDLSTGVYLVSVKGNTYKIFKQ